MKLATRDREGTNGVALLAEISALCEPPLAVSAAERLARHSGLDETLDPAAAALVVRALLRTDAGPELSTALLEVVARERRARARRSGVGFARALAPAVVFEALAARSIPASPCRGALLRRPPAPAKSRCDTSGPNARVELARLARSDPALAVRAVASAAPGAGGESAPRTGSPLHDLIPACAARPRALGSASARAPSGAAAEGGLERPDAARAAVVALHLTGTPEAATRWRDRRLTPTRASGRSPRSRSAARSATATNDEASQVRRPAHASTRCKPRWGRFFRERCRLLDAHQGGIEPGARALRLPDFCIETDGEPHTLVWQGNRVAVKPGHQGQARARLTAEQLGDLVNDQSTPIAWMSNRVLDMPEGALPDFLNWWLVLRAALDGRRIHARGDVTFESGLRRTFTPDDSDEEMRAFLEQAGYLHIRGLFSVEEMKV